MCEAIFQANTSATLNRRLCNKVAPLQWRTRWVVIVLVWIAYFAPSVASPADAQTAKIVGIGAATCPQFEADISHNPPVQRDYLAWAQGFLSGVLLSRPVGVDQGLDLNPSSFGLMKQLDFLRNHCAGHRADDFSEAVLALYKDLRLQK